MREWQYKVPHESSQYPEWSDFVREQIQDIVRDSMDEGRNQIYIHTNLKKLPLENINKVAGPFVEAWALEQFEAIIDDKGNSFALINVEQGRRLDPCDIILQFKRVEDKDEFISANVDVKATAEDIPTSGKSPNITSYARIRSEYVDDPDYIFIVLSLKHRVYSERNEETNMVHGIMEIVSYSVFDLKYVSSADLNYNPALGTGQLQIRDIHYVEEDRRTTWEFLQMLDEKFIRSKDEDAWLKLAEKYNWIRREL